MSSPNLVVDVPKSYRSSRLLTSGSRIRVGDVRRKWVEEYDRSSDDRSVPNDQQVYNSLGVECTYAGATAVVLDELDTTAYAVPWISEGRVTVLSEAIGRARVERP